MSKVLGANWNEIQINKDNWINECVGVSFYRKDLTKLMKECAHEKCCTWWNFMQKHFLDSMKHGGSTRHIYYSCGINCYVKKKEVQ